MKKAGVFKKDTWKIKFFNKPVLLKAQNKLIKHEFSYINLPNNTLQVWVPRGSVISLNIFKTNAHHSCLYGVKGAKINGEEVDVSFEALIIGDG